MPERRERRITETNDSGTGTPQKKGELNFMNYTEFEATVCSIMQEKTGSEVSVRPETMTRNNQITNHGLLFEKANSNIAPRIYLDAYYQEYLDGTPLNEIVTDICSLYREIKDVPSVDVNSLFSFDTIKDKIVYHLVNYKKNEERLSQNPHIRFHDLAIEFYIHFDVSGSGSASCSISNSHLDFWKKTKEEIYTYAKKNTHQIFPLSLIPMESIFLNCISECEDIDRSALSRLMAPGFEILTNKQQLFGAACILYEHVLETIGMKLQENYYVIPSSTHEVLILRESIAKDCGSLSKMIQDVNSSAVADEDVLADHPYYYDCSAGILRMA